MEYHVFAGLSWLKLPLLTTLGFVDQDDEIFNQENNKTNKQTSNKSTMK